LEEDYTNTSSKSPTIRFDPPERWQTIVTSKTAGRSSMHNRSEFVGETKMESTVNSQRTEFSNSLATKSHELVIHFRSFHGQSHLIFGTL